MLTHLHDAVASVALALVVAASSIAIAQINGTVVAIDPARGTFRIHHDPFPAMPMAMTMDVEPKVRGDLKRLHVGERVSLTVDTSVYPWDGTNIRPASGAKPAPKDNMSGMSGMK